MQRLFNEKRRFVRRWPERDYRPRQDGIGTVCNPAGEICTVHAVFDFTASHPKRRRMSRGTGALQLVVHFIGDKPVIVAEHSTLLGQERKRTSPWRVPRMNDDTITRDSPADPRQQLELTCAERMRETIRAELDKINPTDDAQPRPRTHHRILRAPVRGGRRAQAHHHRPGRQAADERDGWAQTGIHASGPPGGAARAISGAVQAGEARCGTGRKRMGRSNRARSRSATGSLSIPARSRTRQSALSMTSLLPLITGLTRPRELLAHQHDALAASDALTASAGVR